MLEREWLLGVARQEREALGRTIQYTRPEAWEAESPWLGRSVADVVAHLAASDVAAAAVYGGEEPIEMAEYAKTLDGAEVTSEGFIDWSLARRAQQDPVVTGLEWGRAADLLLARASKTSGEDWHEHRLPWFGGELRTAHFLQNRVCQWWVHGQDVLEGGGQDLRREHPPTFVVNDFAVRLLPYALSRAGESFPRMTARVELEGVGGGSWTQRLDSPEAPDPSARADVVIDGRGEWFALLAMRRTTPDLMLYEGLLNAGGDAAAADAVLRCLRAFP